MDTGFSFQVTVSILPGNGQGSAFYPGLVTWQEVHEFYLKSLPFSPPCIHPHEDLCPVLTFRAARARMYCHYSVAPVLIPGKNTSELHIIKLTFQAFNPFPGIIEKDIAVILLGQFKENVYVLQFFLYGMERLEGIFDIRFFFEKVLGPGR